MKQAAYHQKWLAFNLAAVRATGEASAALNACIDAFFDTEAQTIKEFTPEVANQVRAAQAGLRNTLENLSSQPSLRGTLRVRNKLLKGLELYVQALGLMADGVGTADLDLLRHSLDVVGDGVHNFDYVLDKVSGAAASLHE